MFPLKSVVCSNILNLLFLSVLRTGTGGSRAAEFGEGALGRDIPGGFFKTMGACSFFREIGTLLEMR